MQYAYAINKTRCYGSVYLGVVVLSGCELCWAVYKSGTGTRGRGHRDACVGTGTWGRETRDLRTSSMGRGDVWDGDAGMSNTGTQGTRDVNDYRKSRR